MIIKDEVS